MSRAIGNTGEEIARQYLQSKGYKFVEANWSCPMGEIDLIMRDGSTLVFVEVKLRQPTSFGSGVDVVARQKQQKLTRAAQAYQQRNNYWGDVRFDVISITAQSDKDPVIEHVEWAF